MLLTDTTIGPKEVRQQLRDAGVAVVMISSERRIDSNDDLVAEVAAALGVTERGTALAKSLSAEIAAATAADFDLARALALLIHHGGIAAWHSSGEPTT